MVSIFYKVNNVKEKLSYGFEVEYKRFGANVTIDYRAGHASFYHNVRYDFNLTNFYLIYEKSIFSKSKIGFKINGSPYFGYIITSSAKGHGWRYEYISEIDGDGEKASYLTTKDWTKDEMNTKDLAKFITGVRLGFELVSPINERFKMVFNNSYNLGLNNILKIKDARYTVPRNIEIKLGLCYCFEDRILRILKSKE